MKTKNKDREKGFWRKSGFTLGEVVMTVAIVGTLTAVAVPNYMRIRMNVNMEMVKQQLKKMGTHMNELYNQNHEFPENVLNLGNGDDEVAVTASLNAIDSMRYTTNEYMTSSNRSLYQFRTCPVEGSWGVSGDKCFLLTPEGVSDAQRWQSWDRMDFALSHSVGAFCNDGCVTIEQIFHTSNPDTIDIRDWFLAQAAYGKMRIDVLVAAQGEEVLHGAEKDKPAVYLQGASDALINLLNRTLSDPSFQKDLARRGVEVAYFPPIPGSLGLSQPLAPDREPSYGFSLSPSFRPEGFTDRIPRFANETQVIGAIYYEDLRTN